MIFFCLDILKGTAKACTLDLLRTFKVEIFILILVQRFQVRLFAGSVRM